EGPEVGAADVDQLRRGFLRAVRDREQRDDQPHAERHAGRRQRRPNRTPQEVPYHQAGPGHTLHLRYAHRRMEASREEILKALEQVIDPELKRNVVELDMVCDVRIAGEEVTVGIALTVAVCP